MSTAYTPREGSVAWKVIQFLQANQGECLDADLISAKCECDRRNVHTLLGPAVQAGLLVREEDTASGELVYKVGHSTALTPTPSTGSGFHAWLDRKGQASAEGRTQRVPSAEPPPAPVSEKKRSGPFYIDVSTVAIDKGVPMPNRGSRAMDWNPLLVKLDVGDSFLLPGAAKSAIGTAMKAFKDATGKELSSRKVDGGIRVWRIA